MFVMIENMHQELKCELMRLKRCKESKKDYDDRLQAFELDISTTDTNNEADEYSDFELPKKQESRDSYN